MRQNGLEFIRKLLQQAGQIDSAVFQSHAGQAVFCNFQKFIDQLLQPFRLGQGDGEIFFPQLLGELPFVPQQMEIADRGGQRCFQVMGQIHNQIVFPLLGGQHIAFLPVNPELRRVQLPLYGQQLGGQGYFSGNVLEQGVQTGVDFLEISCEPPEIHTEQDGKYQEHGQEKNEVHAASEGALIQCEGTGVVHAEKALQAADHPACKAAAQQKRIYGVDNKNSGSQHGGGPQKESGAQLAEILAGFTFQWYIPLPISFL